MADITFRMLDQYGHIGPALHLGRKLRSSGHKVTLCQAEEYRQMIEDSALIFQTARNPEAIDADLIILDRVLAEFRVNLPKMGSPFLVVSTSLLNWNEPVDLPSGLPLIVLCPERLEVPKFRYPRKFLFYVEPSVRGVVERTGPAGGMKRVLCVFGTQSIRHTRLYEHLTAILALALMRQDVHFHLVSPHLEFLASLSIPGNVSLSAHVAQTAIVAQYDALIFHGGLGSLKEAILAGIPCIALPSFGDQFFNAMRIRHFGIGAALFEERQNADHLSKELDRILAGEYACNVQSMRERFCSQAYAGLSSVLIAEALAAAGSASRLRTAVADLGATHPPNG